MFWEYIKAAIKSVKNNKGRSALTMLGIIIGISSVIMIVSLGNGFKEQLTGELMSSATKQIEFQVNNANGGGISFTMEDCEALNRLDHVTGTSPYFYEIGSVKGPKCTSNVALIGGSEALKGIENKPIESGRFFTAAERAAGAAVCVLSENDAVKLFGTSDVVGLTVSVAMNDYTQELKIVGVIDSGEDSLVSSLSSGSYIYLDVPDSLLGTRFGVDITKPEYVEVFMESGEHASEVYKAGVSVLERRHNCRGKELITGTKGTDAIAQYQTILSMITIFISLIAAISLIVGGIGVMNIMMVSVTERTREIGIRKSLGARTGSIMLQFLAESGIITMIGGIVGIILGLGLANLVGNIAKLPPVVSPGYVLGVTLFSCGVGIFFGLAPAKKAAKLRPIDALRHE